jgi:ech hydrogenase subunit B
MTGVQIAVLAGLGVMALLAPIGVGIVLGVDRQVTAAIQRRAGPPLLQPLYDLTKLVGKLSVPADRLMSGLLVMQLGFSAMALVMVAVGADLVVAILLLGAGHVMFLLAAASVESPYAQLGASRELVLLVAREPLLLLAALAYTQATGSSSAGAILASGPILLKLPTLGITLAVLLGIALQKSPWDLATSHHGHQELVKGSTTEMAGPFLAIGELSHWYEVAFILTVILLVAGTALWLGLILVGLAYAAVLIVDNAVPRATWRVALATAWGIGGLAAFVAMLTAALDGGGIVP